MSIVKPTRLAKAASYYNVSREEIVKYLTAVGFDILDNPNSKIDEAMNEWLEDKYSEDRILKEESAQFLSHSKPIEQDISGAAAKHIIEGLRVLGKVDLSNFNQWVINYNRKASTRIKVCTDTSVINCPNTYILDGNGKLVELHIDREAFYNLSFLNGQSSLKVLVMTWCSLNNLEHLRLIPNIEKLILDGNDISHLRDLKYLDSLKYFGLLNNQSYIDFTFPDSVSSIKFLHIDKCKDSTYHLTIDKLESLVELHVRDNPKLKLIKISTNLENLIEANLENNDLNSVEYFKSLSSLKYLHIAGNPVCNKISKEALKSNNVNEILNYRRPEIEQFERETGFYIAQDSYSVIDDKINCIWFEYYDFERWESTFIFSHVKILSFFKCKIGEFETIENFFPSINELDIRESIIYDLSNLLHYINIQSLIITNCSIRQIHFLTPLNNLTELNLAFNGIVKIEGIDNLTKVENLNLGFNELEYLDGFENLKNLKILDVNNNNIKSINNLFNLDKLEEVDLIDNPIQELEDIPEEEITAGWTAIRNYYNSLNELVAFKEVKILLLGNPNIGKSDLLEFLETKATPTEKPSTHGIEYKKLKREGSETTFHVWDFGGQEYYHATHKLFFSPNALSIVLWGQDINRNEVNENCFEIEYWLRCIEQLNPIKRQENQNEEGDKNLVLLLENKIDLNNYQTKKLNQLELESNFRELNIYYHSISLQNLKRTNGLLEIIDELTAKLIKKRPKNYIYFLDKVNKETKPYIDIKKLVTSKYTENDVRSALRVFHNMGILLYFEEIIPSKAFVKPDILLELLYRSVLSQERKSSLTKEEIKNCIKDNRLKLNEDEVIKLLKHFDLVFQIQENDVFFVPQYLSPAPSLINFFNHYEFSRPNLKIISDSYLMSLVMLKLFSKYGKYVKQNQDEVLLFWNNGIIIEKDSILLLIKFDRVSQSIELYPDKLQTNIELQKDVVNFILQIPTVSVEENGAKPDWLSPYFNIQIINSRGKYANWEDIKKFRNSHKFLSNSNEHFTKDFNAYVSEEQRVKTIAISYSKDDLELVNSFIKSLQPLILDGITDDPWYCSYLSPGDDVHNKISHKFEEADILCFMCSNNFFKTSYIIEHELKPALRRKKNGSNQLILPIIIDRCKWTFENEEINLGRFAGFPYKGKPVTDFKNWNDAWYVTNWFLETIIRKELNNDYEPSSWN